jgi:hypothetical protein
VGSPVITDGRGLKQVRVVQAAGEGRGSPVITDGRGLKLGGAGGVGIEAEVRPSSLTGVD